MAKKSYERRQADKARTLSKKSAKARKSFSGAGILSLDIVIDVSKPRPIKKRVEV